MIIYAIICEYRNYKGSFMQIKNEAMKPLIFLKLIIISSETGN